MNEQRQHKNRSRTRDDDKHENGRRGGRRRNRGRRGGRGNGSGDYNPSHRFNDNRSRSDYSNGGGYNGGNQRERISVESGYLVLIDQFMLANPYFTDKLNGLIDEAPEKKNTLISEFGGQVVEVPPGLYRIDRDPYNLTIVIHPEGVDSRDLSPTKEKIGRVYVDTRCLAMIDRELLDDPGLIEKYNFLWHSDQNKACRDLLRDNGGAVRYGFSKEQDELQIVFTENKTSLIITPYKKDDNQEEAR
jgi:hypothetical protein